MYRKITRRRAGKGSHPSEAKRSRYWKSSWWFFMPIYFYSFFFCPFSIRSWSCIVIAEFYTGHICLRSFTRVYVCSCCCLRKKSVKPVLCSYHHSYINVVISLTQQTANSAHKTVTCSIIYIYLCPPSHNTSVEYCQGHPKLYKCTRDNCRHPFPILIIS